MTRNQIEYQKHLETKRSNRANEALETSRIDETRRHNYATEGLDRDKLTETNRHNLVQEQLNQAELNETVRYHDIQAQDKDEELLLKSMDIANNKVAASGYMYDKGKSFLMSEESNVGKTVKDFQKQIADSDIYKFGKQVLDTGSDLVTIMNPWSSLEKKTEAWFDLVIDFNSIFGVKKK